MSTDIELVFDTVRHNLKGMLAACGDDTSYIQEHGDAIAADRFLTDVIALNTDKTVAVFALSVKNLSTIKDEVRSLSADDIMAGKWWYDLTNTKPPKKASKHKHFVVITEERPSPKTREVLEDIDRMLNKTEGTFRLFLREELMYNPHEHYLVPRHRVLTTKEKEQVMRDNDVTNTKSFPSIKKDDAMARWLRAMIGDVFEITRNSPTAGESKYYRVCVP